MLNETVLSFSMELKKRLVVTLWFSSDSPQKMNTTMTLKARDLQLYNKIQCPKTFSVGGWSFGCANERLISRNLLAPCSNMDVDLVHGESE